MVARLGLCIHVTRLRNEGGGNNSGKGTHLLALVIACVSRINKLPSAGLIYQYCARVQTLLKFFLFLFLSLSDTSSHRFSLRSVLMREGAERRVTCLRFGEPGAPRSPVSPLRRRRRRPGTHTVGAVEPRRRASSTAPCERGGESKKGAQPVHGP